jgi:hypothetical protein
MLDARQTDSSLPWASLVASDSQMYGSRIVRVEGGSGDGARLLEVWTPAGLRLEFTLDRALDIYDARLAGQPIAWMGPPGLKTRHEHEPTGFGWLRTFHGGLLVTCGLDHFGAPATRDAAEHLPPEPRDVHHGEHGRISHQSASLLRCEVALEPEPAFHIIGEVVQASLYGEQFILRRHYRVSLLHTEIELTDTVVNVGPLPTRLALLYHFNFGYPLVDAETTYLVNEGDGPVTRVFGRCTPDAREQVLRANPIPDGDGVARAGINHRPTGRGIELAYDAATLPALFVWSLPRTRANVLGLAPASAWSPEVGDRLEPGSKRTFHWTLSMSGSPVDSAGGPAPPDR